MKLESSAAQVAGRTFKQRVEEVRPGRSRRCPRCGLLVKFTGDDGRKAQRPLDAFERELKKLDRSFRL